MLNKGWFSQAKNSHELRKEDIPLVKIDVNVNFNQWNDFFCSNPVDETSENKKSS